MNGRVEVGVLGATGTVGERLVRLLDQHPWFDLVEVGASERSAGSTLGALLGEGDDGPLPGRTADLEVRPLEGTWRAPLLLSALPSGIADGLEKELARAGHVVVSNASSHRMTPDVPLVIPEVNPDHLDLAAHQSWPGRIVTNPNCVVTGLALALAPLEEAFGIESAVVTTYQAISGAGKPGPSAGDLLDNVIPWIKGEEEKIGPEVRKILGSHQDGTIREAPIRLSASVARVPVAHGHLASVSLAFRSPAGVSEVTDALCSWVGRAEPDALPTAPAVPLQVLSGNDRPQPRLDRNRGLGMTVTVGRIRPCEVHDVKLLVLSHNLLRGAAGAALLNAELAWARGLLAQAGVAAGAEATA